MQLACRYLIRGRVAVDRDSPLLGKTWTNWNKEMGGKSKQVAEKLGVS